MGTAFASQPIYTSLFSTFGSFPNPFRFVVGNNSQERPGFTGGTVGVCLETRNNLKSTSTRHTDYQTYRLADIQTTKIPLLLSSTWRVE